MRDGIETDESRWPLVIHRTVGIPDEATVDAFIARANRILERAEPHAVIFESTYAGRSTKYMRNRNIEWLKTNQERLSQCCVATAIVTPSAAMRFMMSGVMLVWTSPTPYKVFKTLPEAEAWTAELLRPHR